MEKVTDANANIVLTDARREQIKSIIDNFCIEEGFENLRQAPPNTFLACLSEISRNVFKAKTERYKDKNIINYSDIDQLNEIYEFYKELCDRYNKEISINSFSRFSGIGTTTLYSWLKEEGRTIIYIDKYGNYINDINKYNLLHSNIIKINSLNDIDINSKEYIDNNYVVEVISSSHSNFVKKIKTDNEQSLANIGIGDRNNTGVAMKLNSKFGWNSVSGREAQPTTRAAISTSELEQNLKLLE